jgi:hypothetical protein|nr:MAG TPA: hypothetical protein [Caudoviricetes sp.]
MCHKSGDPSYLSSYYIDDEHTSPNLFVHFFCHNCEKTFLGNYHIRRYYDITDLRGFEPVYDVEEREFSKHIKDLSPDFCSIYNQAYASQQYRLNDISGMAYRKALEFLVKDYAIFLHPDDKEAIIKAPLSQCINNYIDNGKIKHLAVASAWIGNDETHYERKQQEYNVDDLIEFINAIVSFIDFDISAIHAEKMTKKN